MKFIVSKTLLAEALNITGKVISTNNVVPVLGCYLFRMENNSLMITGSNLQTFITKQIPIEGNNFEALIAIPAARLSNLIKELPEQPLQFLIEETSDHYNVTITAASGTYLVVADAGKDYPDLKNEKQLSFTMPHSNLVIGISKTLFACSTDELRPAMTGVLVSFKEKQVTYTATNAAMLSTFSCDVDVDTDQSFIVPAKVLSILLTLSGSKDIVIELDAKSIVFNVDENTVLKSRLIDEKYPDYQSVIPKDNNQVFTTDKYELISSLKRITQFAEGNNHKVTMEIDKSNCSIKTDNSLGETAFETLKHSYNGEPIAIGIDGKNLLSCLTKKDSEEISMSFSSAKRAMLLREIGPEVSDETNLMLLMPLTV